jgi:hypothetical protein
VIYLPLDVSNDLFVMSGVDLGVENAAQGYEDGWGGEGGEQWHGGMSVSFSQWCAKEGRRMSLGDG